MEMDMMGEDVWREELMNCNGWAVPFLMTGRTLEEQCVKASKSMHKCVCISVCDIVCTFLSLSGSSVLSPSVQSRRLAPLSTHNPFLPRRFTLLQFAPTLRWSYRTMHTPLACPPSVSVCVSSVEDCIFPQTCPLLGLHVLLFLCKGSPVGQFTK